MAILDSNRGSFSESLVIKRPILPVVSCMIAMTVICFLTVAVRPQGRREIVSDDFTNPRPTPTPKPARIFGGLGGINSVRTNPAPAPKHYRLAASSSPNASPLTAADNIEQLGITLWRLRP